MEPISAGIGLISALIAVGMAIWKYRQSTLPTRKDNSIDDAMATDDLHDLAAVQHGLNDRLRRKDGGAQ